MSKANYEDSNRCFDKNSNNGERARETVNNEKKYFEFLKDAKSNQRNASDTSSLNRGHWDDSDYNAIFMTF